jgi:hypothetical protein
VQLGDAVLALGLPIQESSFKGSVRGIWGKDPAKCSFSDTNRLAVAMVYLENGTALNGSLSVVSL